jgi:hypothetical protein
MKWEIKNRFNDSVIFACEADSLKLAVCLAVSKKISLDGANLYGANLYGANLTRASLVGASLDGAKNLTFQICPEEGDFIAFKKISSGVIKIRVTGKRTSTPIGRKCRCSKCVVLEGEDGVDNHTKTIKYSVGKTITPDSYNDDIRLECTNGIHFFMTRAEAENY